MNRTSLLLVLLMLFTRWTAAADPPLEYQVKAVCVLNAARFVSWPETSFSSDETPLVIGVLGDNPFGALLHDAVKSETVRKRRIVVRSVTLAEAPSACHVLFISRTEKDNLGAILQAMNKANVLTISDMEGFANAGGMLGLVLDRGKIRFEYNPAAAQAAGLKFDPQFTSLCRIIKPRRP